MTKTIPAFHLRMTPELKLQLQSASDANGNSLNREIVERLERSFDPDPALKLTEALRAHLEKLDARDSKKAIGLAVDIIALLSKAPSKK